MMTEPTTYTEAEVRRIVAHAISTFSLVMMGTILRDQGILKLAAVVGVPPDDSRETFANVAKIMQNCPIDNGIGTDYLLDAVLRLFHERRDEHAKREKAGMN